MKTMIPTAWPQKVFWKLPLQNRHLRVQFKRMEILLIPKMIRILDSTWTSLQKAKGRLLVNQNYQKLLWNLKTKYPKKNIISLKNLVSPSKLLIQINNNQTKMMKINQKLMQEMT